MKFFAIFMVVLIGNALFENSCGMFYTTTDSKVEHQHARAVSQSSIVAHHNQQWTVHTQKAGLFLISR